MVDEMADEVQHWQESLQGQIETKSHSKLPLPNAKIKETYLFSVAIKAKNIHDHRETNANNVFSGLFKTCDE